jgi:hypothetical protein
MLLYFNAVALIGIVGMELKNVLIKKKRQVLGIRDALSRALDW